MRTQPRDRLGACRDVPCLEPALRKLATVTSSKVQSRIRVGALVNASQHVVVASLA